MAGYTIKLTAPDGTERFYDRINSVDLARTHTALSDWEASLPYDPTLENRVFDRFDLYFNGNHLFRGFLERVELDASAGEVTIGGRDLGRELLDSGAAKQYYSTAAHNEIFNYIENEIPGFTSWFTPPSPTEVVSDQTVLDYATAGEWDSAFDAVNSAYEPVYVQNGELRLAQTAWVAQGSGTAQSAPAGHREINGFGSGEVSGDARVKDGYANYIGGGFGRDGDDFYFNFTPKYTVPFDQIGMAVRFVVWDDAGGGPDGDDPDADIRVQKLEYRMDGNSYATYGSESRGFGAFINSPADPVNSRPYDAYVNWLGGPITQPDLTGGQSHTFQILARGDGLLYDSSYSPPENAVESDRALVDAMAVWDDRFTSDNLWSDTLHEDFGRLNRVDIYPPNPYTVAPEAVAGADTLYNIGGYNHTATTPTGTNATGVRLGGELLYNSPVWGSWGDLNVSKPFATGQYSSSVTPRYQFRSYTPSTGPRFDTPRYDYEAGALDTSTLGIAGNDLAVIDNASISGNHLQNLQRLSDLAGYRFVVLHNENAKVIRAFKPGDVVDTLPRFAVQNENRVRDVTDYANSVTVRGELNETTGDRVTVTLDNPEEIATIGNVVGYDHTDPNIDNEADAASEARKTLGSRQGEDSRTGTLSTTPKKVTPGLAYQVTWLDGTTTVADLESVTLTERRGQARGELNFRRNPRLSHVISELEREQRSTKDAI